MAVLLRSGYMIIISRYQFDINFRQRDDVQHIHIIHIIAKTTDTL